MFDPGPASSMWLDADSMEIRFSARHDERQVLCRITREAIDDHCGTQKSDRARLEVARNHFGTIVKLLERKAAAGRTEADGSLLIRSKDWQFV